MSSKRDHYRTLRDDSGYNFYDRRNNRYRSNYSNNNNSGNVYRGGPIDRLNQTVNLYSDRELGLKYRFEINSKTIIYNLSFDLNLDGKKQFMFPIFPMI